MAKKKKGRKTKSKRQVAFLFSSRSPLSTTQKDKLKNELVTGAVKFKKGPTFE
jgi:hypothetical protein